MIKFRQFSLLALVVAGAGIANGGEIQFESDFKYQITDPYHALGEHIGQQMFDNLTIFKSPASYTCQLFQGGASYVSDMEIGYSTKRYLFRGINFFSLIAYRVFYHCPFSIMPDFKPVFEKVTPDFNG
jgi:hypothetical protein